MNTQEGADGKPTQVSQTDDSEVSAWPHECEWTEEADAEADLHLHLNNCKKNPGHKNFIPIGQFNIDHLPPDYRDKNIVKWTRLTAHLTVKVWVKYVSVDRPETFPDTDLGKYIPHYKDKVGGGYPFSASKGSDTLRTGTAWVWYVHRYCNQCLCELNCPHKVGGKVWLCTARHVVYDNSEAKKTELIFHYDSEENQQGIRVERPRKVEDCSTERDVCYMSFSSHDVEFLNWLEETLKQRNNLRDKLYNKYIKPKLVLSRDLQFQCKSPSTHLPVLIVSHPHGCAKMVTVGEVTEVLEGEEDENKLRYVAFNYTSDTCQGSGGAPVCCLDWRWGQGLGLFTFPPHCADLEDGVNRSAAWACGEDKSEQTSISSYCGSHIIFLAAIILFCFIVVFLVAFLS